MYTLYRCVGTGVCKQPSLFKHVGLDFDNLNGRRLLMNYCCVE